MGANRVDVLIIGAGLAGSAAAWALARRGRSAVVLEAFQPGHRRGSSHGSARIFRRAYPDPLYVRLTGEAHRLWRQLADEAGEELVLTTGGIDFGPSREQEKLYEILRAFGVAAELLPPGAAAERWPGVAFGTDPGDLLPRRRGDRRGARHARDARTGRGARGAGPLRLAGAECVGLGGGGVVRTADRSWQAPAVVVAAGAWVEPLLGGQVSAAAAGRDPAAGLPFRAASLGRAAAGLHLPQRGGRHLRPAGRARRRGTGAMSSVSTATARSPRDGRDGIVSPAGGRWSARSSVTRSRASIRPGRRGDLLYTSTATKDFILDRQGPFVVCSACSGHGAKFAPLTGEIAADLACGDTTPDRRFTLAAHRA